MSVDYEDVPYEGHPIEYASPHALALAARRDGGPARSLEAAHVLDIGCGDGAHLLPLAFHHPDWTLLGLDTSPRAIAAARRGAESLGLGNARFEVADVRGYDVAPSSFDVVTAHGIYSWVDADTRSELRALMRRALSPGGLGYVCFNALPGWGVRGRVRDRLLGLGLGEARARARSLRALLDEAEDVWAQLLRNELDRVEAASDGYLAHEYLAPHNDAFWLEHVVDDFARAGLRYAGDAQGLYPEGYVAPSLGAAVSPLVEGESALAAPQLTDLLAYRQLRGAIFERDDAPPAEPSDAWFEEAALYGVLRAMSDPFDPQPGVEEPFTAGDVEVRVASGIGKMALLTMSSRYPDAFPFDELVRLAADGLAGRGYRPDLDAAERLRGGLRQLVDHQMVRARLAAPRVSVEPGPRPTATRLARFEAKTGAPTTPLHSILPLDPLDRALTVALDGRETAEAARAVAEAIATGRLELEGVPANPHAVAPFVEQRLASLVTTLARWGLLEPAP